MYPEKMLFSDEDPKVMRALRNAEIGLASRTQALTLYGLLGLQVGLAMLFFGAQHPLEEAFTVWARVVFGGMATIGGLLVFAGAAIGDRTQRGWAACLAGALILGAWGTLMAVAYAIATSKTGIHFSWPWDPDPLPAEMGRLFVPALYQTLAILVGLHVVTLVKMGRPRR